MKMTWHKCTFGHGVGNMIASLLSTIDNVLMFVTLGHLQANISLGWTMYRLKTDTWFHQQK